MSEENKRILQRLYDLANSGELDRADEFIHANAVEHANIPGLPPGTHGPDVFKTVFRLSRNAFPDLRVTVNLMVAEGDEVAALLTATGTHTGEEFLGTVASSKPVEFEIINIVRFEAGKVAEHWGVADNARLWQQIGILTHRD